MEPTHWLSLLVVVFGWEVSGNGVSFSKNGQVPDIASEGGSLHRMVEIVTGSIESTVHQMVAEVLIAVYTGVGELKEYRMI